MRKDQDRIPLLGVHIDDYSKQQIFNKLEDFFCNSEFNYISTPNPEIILKASKDNNYRIKVNAADLVIADGIGLLYASFLLNKKVPVRMTGVYLTKKILTILEKKGYSLLILSKKGGLSSAIKIQKYFQENYPNIILNIKEIDTSSMNLELLLDYTKKIKPDAIFAGLGAPYQEDILYWLKQNHVSAKLGLANGGSIDFLIGTQKRAPKLMQSLGLEWLWRLCMQPSRWKRIFNAIIIFPIYTLFWKLRSIFIFRKTIVGCIINDRQEVLIAHLSQHNVWGIPQGGPDPNENLKDAVKREMNEELGISKELLEVKLIVKNIYQYKWPSWHRANRGYKGQRQSLGVLFFSGSDSDIQPDGHEVDAYKWVKVKDMVSSVSYINRNSATIIHKILKEKGLS